MVILEVMFSIFITILLFYTVFVCIKLLESTHKKPLTTSDRCIGKVEIDGLLEYVIYFDCSIAIGSSTIWYSLSGQRYGTMDESSLLDIYRHATIQEAGGYKYPILSVVSLNRRQQLLEKLK